MTVALAHQITGDGPPLMILHGLFGSSRNWRSVARRLQNRLSVISVDLRNHGRSPHAHGMSYFELADDVLTLADQLGLATFHLLGHSMGGKTAMRFALDQPHRLSSLVVADIAPAPSDSDHDPVLAALKSLQPAELDGRDKADRALAARLTDPGLRAFLLQNLARTAGGFEWQIGLSEIEAAMPDLLDFPRRDPEGRFPGPSLFLHGAESNYLRSEHWPTIRALFPDAVDTAIDGAGHWLHAEQPDAFVAALTAFIDSVQP